MSLAAKESHWEGVHVGQPGHDMGRLAAEAGATIHEQAEIYDFTFKLVPGSLASLAAHAS